MAETLKSFNDGIGQVMHRSKSIDHHLTHASASVLDMLKSLAGIHLVQKGIETLANNSTWGRNIALAFSTAKLDARALARQQRQADSDLKDFNATYRERLKNGELTRSQAAREKLDLRENLRLLSAQAQFKSRLQEFGKAELIMSGAFLTTAISTFHVFTQVGKVLQESNSGLTERLQLTRSILNVQRELGSDMRESVEAARDLVDYGYDLDGSFKDTLKLVIQMKDGLGLSTKLGAELAVVYDRQLRTSARSVADSMARLVNDTSVAADEAGRLAVNIGRAVSLLKPGVNADLSAVTELVGRYEGALKSLGGTFGGFEQLLTKMTTPEGLLGAGVLGVNSPEFIRSKDATRLVLDNFATYAKNFLGNSQGWERAMRLESLSEIFGTTTQQVNLMIRAVDEANKQRSSTITAEERYREQVFATGQVFSRLKNTLVALGQQAVLPLIDYTTAFLQPISEWLEVIRQIPGLVKVAGVVMVGGAILATAQVYKLSRALYTMASAAHFAAVKARERAMSPVLDGAGGLTAPGSTGAAARSAGLLGRIIGVTSAVIIAAAVGAAIGVAIRHAFHLDRDYVTATLNRSNKDFYGALFKHRVVREDIPGLRQAMIAARGAYLKDGMTLAEANARIGNQVKDLEKVTEAVRFTKEVTKSLFGPTPQEAAEIESLNETQKALVSIAEEQKNNAVQSRQIQEKHLKIVEEQKQESGAQWLWHETLRQNANMWNNVTDFYGEWFSTGKRPTR